jgi:hypothetical protein
MKNRLSIIERAVMAHLMDGIGFDGIEVSCGIIETETMTNQTPSRIVNPSISRFLSINSGEAVVSPLDSNAKTDTASRGAWRLIT